MQVQLQKVYKDEIVNKLKESLSLKNSLLIPKLVKIVINMGVGKAIGDMKILDSAVEDLTTISGQKPVCDKSKNCYFKF